MARSSVIYIVRDELMNVIAAFTVKHEMHAAARHHGWYERPIPLSVLVVADGVRAIERRLYQLDEPVT